MRMWCQVIAVLLLVAASTQGSSFTYSWDNSTGNPGEVGQYGFFRQGDAGWNYAGAYTQNVLTSWSAGEVYNTQKRNTSLGFDMSASVTVHPNQNGDLPTGFAFILNGDSRGLNALPSIGPWQSLTDTLGYEGLYNSVAIEYDLRSLTGGGGPHVGVSLNLDGGPITADHGGPDGTVILTDSANLPTLTGAGAFGDYTLDMRVVFDKSDDRLDIYLNNQLISQWTSCQTMPTNAYIGFGGGGSNVLEFPVSTLNSFTYSSAFVNPEPTTVALMAVAFAALYRRKRK